MYLLFIKTTLIVCVLSFPFVTMAQTLDELFGPVPKDQTQIIFVANTSDDWNAKPMAFSLNGVKVIQKKGTFYFALNTLENELTIRAELAADLSFNSYYQPASKKLKSSPNERIYLRLFGNGILKYFFQERDAEWAAEKTNNKSYKSAGVFYTERTGNDELVVKQIIPDDPDKLTKEMIAKAARDAEIRSRELKAAAEQAQKLLDAQKAEREKLEAERAKLAAEKAAARDTELRTQELLAAAEERTKKLLAEQEARIKKLTEQTTQDKASAHKAQQSASEKKKAKLLAARQQSLKENRHSVAVIIGNRNYTDNNPDVPNVDFAHNDANAIYRYVKENLGYQEGNIILLKDASQAELISVFGNERTHRGKLFNWVDPDQSNVFVYYSGHGAPGLSDGSGYLLPVNADPMAVELNGYPLTTLYQNLAKVPARNMTVVLDACFSGSSASGNLVKNASSIALRHVKTESVLKNGSVLTAAAVSEVASWDQEQKMGLFTAKFLEGVSGGADSKSFGNSDGRVSLGELKKFLGKKVTYEARRQYYRDQNPQVSGDEKQILNHLYQE